METTNDVTALLRRDHDGVRGLFQAFENAGDDAQARRSLFLQIREALAVHERVEEEIFYPAVRAAGDDGPELVEDAESEHRGIDELLEKVGTFAPDERRFLRKMRKLRRRVEHHAAEEEEEIFPFARTHFGDTRLAELGARIAERKRELSPRNPDSFPGPAPQAPRA